jgi:acyl carrier protein
MHPETLERVREIVASYLGIPRETIADDAPLPNLGVDSLSALEIVFRIEEEFGVSVPDERVLEFTTLRAICDGIESLRGDGAATT